jgi:dihydrofolate reductase
MNQVIERIFHGPVMIISLIAAMDENHVIGRGNRMPWSLPTDRARFHAITRGHPVIMGRKTHESIGRPLPNRTNIVLSRRKNYRPPGCIVAHGLGEAYAACDGADEAFICGGGEVFGETIARADKIFLTVVRGKFEGDAFFPEIPPFFEEVERRTMNGDVIPYDLILYARKTPGRSRRAP